MKVKELVLKFLAEKEIDTIRPKEDDYHIEKWSDIEVTEASLYAACNQLVKDGKMKRGKFWSGHVNATYRQQRYYTEFKLCKPL